MPQISNQVRFATVVTATCAVICGYLWANIFLSPKNTESPLPPASIAQTMPSTIPNDEFLAKIEVNPSSLGEFLVDSTPDVIIAIRNVGKSPAYETEFDAYVGIAPYPFPGNPAFPPTMQDPQVFTLLPGEGALKSVRYAVPITKETYDSVADGTRTRLFVGGNVQFKDVVGKTWRRRFLMSIGGPSFVDALRAYQEKKPYNLAWERAKQFNDVIQVSNGLVDEASPTSNPMSFAGHNRFTIFRHTAATWHIGENGITFSTLLDDSGNLEPTSLNMVSSVPFPLLLYAQNGELFINGSFTDGIQAVTVKGTKINDPPKGWDINQDDRAIEIVNDDGGPVLQIFYTGDADIMIKGVFPAPNGQMIYADQAIVMSGTKMGSKATLGNPIFKYPSSQFEGVRVSR